MPVQTFMLEHPETLPSADEQTAERERRLELLLDAGFGDLMAWELDGEDKLFTAKALFPELTGKDYKLWRSFLPTIRDLDAYRYDNVPTEALEAIATAQRLNCFDRIEVWTPEGNSFLGLVARKLEVARDRLGELSSKIDPMAVGIALDYNGREHYFQIVRWGESLLPLKEIRQHVRLVNWKARFLGLVLPLLLAVFAVAAEANAIQHHGFAPTIVLTLMGALVLMFALCVLLLIADSAGWLE